jgi:solute carrier family 25 thiamine pyrophosphate transporter 19
MGIVFYTHDILRSFLPPLMSPDLSAGFFAGLLGKTLILPMDIIRKRYQMQGPDRNRFVVGVPRYSGSIFQSFSQIVQHEGFFALYKGFVPSVLKAGLSSAVTFFIVEHARAALASPNT